MAGETCEVICLDSSDDEKGAKEISHDTPGKVLFEKFVSASSTLIADEKKRTTMVGLMEKRFNQAKEAYRESEELTNILTAHITDLETKKKDAFKHILDVVNVLKSAASQDAKKSKSKRSKYRSDDRTSRSVPKKCNSKSGSDTDRSKSGLLRIQDRTSGSERDSTALESDSYTQLKEETQKASVDQSTSEADTTGQEKNDSGSTSVIGTVAAAELQAVNAADTLALATVAVVKEGDNNKTVKSRSDNDDLNANDKSEVYQVVPHVPVVKPAKRKKKVTNRQIRKYERLLHKLSTEIKRLSEKELSYDEMDQEDSAHILEYQLRKRATKVYEKLCELKEVQPKTGRVSERRIKFEGTRYPEINKKLEKLANLPDYFPDFQDVYILITKVNDRKNLRLERKRMHNIAKDAFEMIGKKLQQRRQEDFLANFSSHPTLDFVEARDPAENDLELQRKLKSNWMLGSQNLNQVAKSYEEKQSTHEQMGIDMEVASANSVEEEDDDDEIIPSPKKKKRRINLITIADEDDDDGKSEHDSHAATTEDDTADEASGHSAHEADDEDDDSDGIEKEEEGGEEDEDDDDDDDDDGAEYFGALSPLTDDDDYEVITDDDQEEVKSPSHHDDDEQAVNDSKSDNNAANSLPQNVTSNPVSSSAHMKSDTDASKAKKADSSSLEKTKTVSLNNGLSKDHDARKVLTKTKGGVPNGKQNGGSHAREDGTSASATQV